MSSFYLHLRLLQPLLELFHSDATLVAFLFLLSGLLAPRVKLAIADTPGLDPRKAALVLPAVDLEHRVVRLLQRPLLESSHRTAAGLTVEWCAVAVLRADAACLGKVPPAVLAATHGDAALHASLQRIADHIRHGVRIQHRRTSVTTHRLEARGQQTERKQLRVAGLVRLVEVIVPHDLPAGFAPGLVYIQYQLEEPLDLLLVQRKFLRQCPQLIQCARYRSLSVPEAYGMKIEPLGIQHAKETVHLSQRSQPDHGVGHTLTVEALQVIGDAPQRDGNLPGVQFGEGQQRLQKGKCLSLRRHALGAESVALDDLMPSGEIHFTVPHSILQLWTNCK